jgi:uncharacterized repeat protein (TIGR03806 family)
VLALAGCDQGPAKVTYFADRNPEHLSEWGVVGVAGAHLALGPRVLPYDLVTPLFTDYASKLRTIWVPEGQAGRYDGYEAFDFPVGTIISKTFYYPKGAEGALVPVAGRPAAAPDGLDLGRVRLIETRLLVRRAAGWEALPYVWDDDQKDAHLARIGDLVRLTLQDAAGARQEINYVVPNANQCQSCHNADYAGRKEARPLGLKARHLNRDYPYPGGARNQLARLTEAGFLVGAPAPDAAPRNADWLDGEAPLGDRARAYVDINCGHCHNPKGLARTTGLYLDAGTAVPEQIGLCKPPVAAGPGTGDRMFDIVPGQPDQSILIYRVESSRLGIMMPELGRTMIHKEGVALLRDWVQAWPGSCR